MGPSEQQADTSQPESARATASERAEDQPDEQPRTSQSPKPQKELLCTICNLRACWEAPAKPAVTP